MQIMITIPDPKDPNDKVAILQFITMNVGNWSVTAYIPGGNGRDLFKNALVQEIVKGGPVPKRKTM